MATVVFKKREGLLRLSKGRDTVSWAPAAPPGAPPEVTVPVRGITNLQQTPPGNPRVKLKVFAQTAGAVEPVAYLFEFRARAEADALRDDLSAAIQAAKAEADPLVGPGAATAAAAAAAPPAVGGRPGAPAAPAAAGTAAAAGQAWDDDQKLLTDDALQKSLLQAQPALSRTLREFLGARPEGLSTTALMAQFWASRVGLLRAHALERAQARGAENVLANVRPRAAEDGALRLHISQEQIGQLFGQHPLLRRAYDEQVPRLSEVAFWSRFFQSRLLKKLRGERATEVDPKDSVFDQYLAYDAHTGLEQRLAAAQVPHVLDLAGNAAHHSQRQGNAPDWPMRPTAAERVPVIRALNALSEKLLRHVAPSDVDPSTPIGMDEATFEQLALRDLQGDAAECRIILNIREQGRFFSGARGDDAANGADPAVARYAAQDPAAVLAQLRVDLAGAADAELAAEIGYDDASDSSSDEEEAAGAAGRANATHPGSKAALRAAGRQISAAVAAQRALTEDLSSSADGSGGTGDTAAAAAAHGLSEALYERVLLTHATTAEFLAQFWAAFLSGEAARAAACRHLVGSLERALDRIGAVAADAEAERAARVAQQQARVEELYRRKGRRRAFDPASVGGGEAAVRQLLAPAVVAIRRACEEYARALAAAGAAPEG